MTRWKQVVVCGLAQVALLTAGCGGVEEAELVPEQLSTLAPEGTLGGVLVSPELFDVAGRWADESSGLQAASVGGQDLLSYVRAHAPELLSETQVALANGSNALSAQSGCSCRVWGAFYKSSTSLNGGAWTYSFTGASHTGRIYQNVSGSKTEHTFNGSVASTELRTRMLCRTATNANCSVGCSARLYADVTYATQLFSMADTGGIWDKASQGEVVDGVTLDLNKPFTTPERLFEKGAAVSHYGSSSTFDPQAFANLLKSTVGIITALKTEGSVANLSGDLIDNAVKSLFGLFHRSGAGGSTSQAMKVTFETAFWQPIAMNYSSTDNLYYGLDLKSDVRMKVRGWGGWHKAESKVSSGYSLAAYVDNFVCDSSVTTVPQRTAFWRYDSTSGAPLTASSLQSRVNSFLTSGFGAQVNVPTNEGVEVTQGVCGDWVCGGFESAFNCAADCTRCGDNVCSGGETVSSCPGDCGYCGDGLCSMYEDSYNCPWDCGSSCPPGEFCKQM